MATTTQASMPGDSEHSRAQLNANFPSRIETTERQLGMLTGSLDRLSEFTSEPKGMEGYEYPKELVEKATSVSISILHQIDEVVNDMCRWNLETSRLEKLYERYLDKSAELQDAQLTQAKVSLFPHVIHNAEVFQVGENEWAAVMGAGKDAYVLGKGVTPYEALRDFDKNFLEGYKPREQQVVEAKPSAQKKRIKKV